MNQSKKLKKGSMASPSGQFSCIIPVDILSYEPIHSTAKGLRGAGFRTDVRGEKTGYKTEEGHPAQEGRGIPGHAWLH